jgi:hypothetical protein
MSSSFLSLLRGIWALYQPLRTATLAMREVQLGPASKKLLELL